MIRRLALLAAACALAAFAQVSFSRSAGKIEIAIGGKPFSNLYYGPEWHVPFLHPLRAESGIAVTRGYPLEQIEGESRDHHFHHGLWYAHADINGVDFWRDKGPEFTGRMAPQSEPKISCDRISCRFNLAAPSGKTMGTIEQTFRFGASGANRIVDVRVVLRADRGAPLRLGDTEEGGLAIRLRDEFREDRGAALMNSDGLSGARQIWGKRAKWVDYSAAVEGRPVGATILDHPDNPRYPTYWHARGYGLCAANPFAERGFLRDKTRDGSLAVPQGGSVTFRYRLVIHPGMVGPTEAGRWAAGFAKEK